MNTSTTARHWKANKRWGRVIRCHKCNGVGMRQSKGPGKKIVRCGVCGGKGRVRISDTLSVCTL